MKTLAFVVATLTLLAPAVSEAQTLVMRREESSPAAPAANFTGRVRIESLFPAAEPSHVHGGAVTFEAGARTAWHSHPRGQTLIITSGTARVQRWNGPIEEARTGDVVRIPPGEKHWHGATPLSPMTHIAIGEHRDGTSVQWMEPVTDEQYNRFLPAPAKPSR